MVCQRQHADPGSGIRPLPVERSLEHGIENRGVAAHEEKPSARRRAQRRIDSGSHGRGKREHARGRVPRGGLSALSHSPGNACRACSRWGAACVGVVMCDPPVECMRYPGGSGSLKTTWCSRRRKAGNCNSASRLRRRCWIWLRYPVLPAGCVRGGGRFKALSPLPGAQSVWRRDTRPGTRATSPDG